MQTALSNQGTLPITTFCRAIRAGTEPTPGQLSKQTPRCALHAVVAPTQRAATLRSLRGHIARFAHPTPSLLAKASQQIDRMLAVPHIGLHSERKEGVPFGLQPSVLRPPPLRLPSTRCKNLYTANNPL